jgi:hypothetical protein
MYLTQDLVTGDLDVHCDGYFLRFRLTDTNVCSAYVDGEVVTDFGDQYLDAAVPASFRMSYDNNQVRTVIEDTPTRIKIRTYAQARNSGQTLLPNTLWTEIIFTVYPDRFTYDYKMEMSGDNELNSSVIHATMYLYHPVAQGYVLYYEDSGSETEETGTNIRDSAKYLLTTNSEASFQSITLNYNYPSGGGAYHQVADDLVGAANNQSHRRQLAMNPTGPELVAGIYYVKVMVIIDTIYREGSAKKYDTLADRISFADQYLDPILDLSPTKGEVVTDMIQPPSITDGTAAITTLHADGSHYYQPNTTPALKVEVDRQRCRSSIVIKDWPFHTGSVTNPVDHLLNHLRMDDDSTSNILIGTTGPDGSWHNISDGSARSTSGDSVQVIGRGSNLDTQGGIAYAELAVGAGTVHDNDFLKKGSVLIKFKPQFAYDTGTFPEIFTLRFDEDNKIEFYYESANDAFQIIAIFGGVEVLPRPASLQFQSNFDLQREIVALVSWDTDEGFMMLAIDGQVTSFEIITGTPTSSEPINFTIGCYYNRTFPGDYIFDEIKTFDEAILPYGAHFIGNGNGLLYTINDPHADLSWYFDGQAALAKGGPNLATDKNPTNSGGQFTTEASLIGSYGWDSNGTGGVLTVTDSGEDIVDYDNGFVGIWFNLQSAVTGGEYLIDVRDADGSDRISAVFDADGNIDVTYRSNSVDATSLGSIPITTGIWNYLRIDWHTDHPFHKVFHSYINGIEDGHAIDILNVWGGGNGLTWHFTEDYNNANGCDAFIGKITMGKLAHTPEVWTAFGKPIHIPTVDKV